MKYFGKKSVGEIDEDAIAAERLMTIAGRFKAGDKMDEPAGTPAEGQEAPEAQGKPN